MFEATTALFDLVSVADSDIVEEKLAVDVALLVFVRDALIDTETDVDPDSVGEILCETVCECVPVSSNEMESVAEAL